MLLVRVVGIALRWLSLLVPEAGERAHWRARWPDSLPDYVRWLESRDSSPARIRRQVVTYLRDGAAEAINARWPGDLLVAALQRRLRSPVVAIAWPAVLLLLGLAVSGGLAPLRRSAQPLVSPPLDGRLVTAEPSKSYFGKSPGFTSQQFAMVRARSHVYERIAGFSMRRVIVDSGPARTVAFATPEFFALLGLPKTATALVAEELGPAWIGRYIDAAGRRYRVSGVWPRHFRPALARPDFWIVESLETFSERRYDTTLAALMKPGISISAATTELRDLMLSAPARRGTGGPDTIVPLRHRQAGIYRALWLAYLLLAAALVARALICSYRHRVNWRKEWFFAAKALPLLTGIMAFAAASLDLRWAASAAGTFFVYWWAGVFAALSLWWAWRDQATRCPECLTRMALSVQVGTHGNPLLEGVGDELLCEYGHGALWLPGAPAQAFGPEVWRSQ